MEIRLADNIRRLRKERSLTQAQLAEALGVTVGAVYKWEARLSLPDIGLLMEMADFFNTSVDLLLGYEMKDNRFEATVARLQEYRRKKDRTGVEEAEKAIKKYPHSFAIARECAAMYNGFGLESGDKAMLLRSLELWERSLPLIDQNTDPQISEQTIYGQMALTYLGLSETDKAIELLKTHNAGGLYNHRIGETLSVHGRCDEALPFLSEAFSGIINELINTVIGYVNVYASQGDYASAQAILRLAIGFFSGLHKDGSPNYLDKLNSGLLAALAGSQFLSGNADGAVLSLEEAKKLAAFFDRSPCYDLNAIRFAGIAGSSGAYDDIGATAVETIGNVVAGFENEALAALWRSVSEQEDKE